MILCARFRNAKKLLTKHSPSPWNIYQFTLKDVCKEGTETGLRYLECPELTAEAWAGWGRMRRHKRKGTFQYQRSGETLKWRDWLGDTKCVGFLNKTCTAWKEENNFFLKIIVHDDKISEPVIYTKTATQNTRHCEKTVNIVFQIF